MKNKEKLFSITLEKDFKVERTKGSGKGGQNRNKRETAIRLTHIESGIQSYCADERSQDQNLRRAWKNLISKPEFKKWLKIKIAREGVEYREMEKQVKKEVDEWMKEENLKIEYI